MKNKLSQKFIEYVKSFNKEPYEFTKDEVYEIGLKHKKLNNNEKCWNELAKLLDFKNGECLRGYIKNRQLKDEILDKNTSLLSNRTIEDVTEEDLVEKKRELMIQAQKTRDERNAYQRLIRDSARIETMIETISDTVDKLKSLPKIQYKGSTKDLNTEAVLLLSDLHIGVECNNFYNKYDTDIAVDRLNKLVYDVIDYCHSMKVKRLNILNLGDMIHGLIHTNARIEQETDVITQVMVASELIGQALSTLQMACPEIIYRSCSDNHSRTISNKEEHIEKENFGRLIDWYLKKRLQNTKIVFEDDNIDYSLGLFSLLNGKKVAFVHGHLDSKTSVVQDLICATRTYIDYICMGHFHCPSTKSFQNTKVFINGSIVGTEQYALSKRLFSEPSQKLVVFDKDNVIDIDIKFNEKE